MFGSQVDFFMIRSLFLFACIAAFGLVSGPADAQQVESESASVDLLADLRNELRLTDPPQTLFEARRAARRAAQKGENYLNSQGYFAPDISYAVAPGEPPVVNLRVEPGPRFTFSSVSVDTGMTPLSSAGQSKRLPP